MTRIVVVGLLAFLASALVPASAFAHRLGVQGRQIGKRVVVEVFYDDDTPAAKAKVQVTNAKDEVVASGVTDEEGKWVFPAPPPGEYLVAADAGAGHRAKKSITVFDPAKAPESKDEAVGPQDEISSPPQGTTISDGPSRAEQTGTPWVKLAIGVTVIGACSGAFLLAFKLKKIAR